MSEVNYDPFEHFKYLNELLGICAKYNVKSYKRGGIEIELFETKATVEPMSFDPKDLVKAFSDSMPPDSAMLFASSEDIIPESEGK